MAIGDPFTGTDPFALRRDRDTGDPGDNTGLTDGGIDEVIARLVDVYERLNSGDHRGGLQRFKEVIQWIGRDGATYNRFLLLTDTTTA